MNAITAPKSSNMNWLEGVTLTAIFHGLPTFAVAVLMLKVAGSHEIIGQPGGGAVIFVAAASLIFAVIARWLGPRFPRLVRNGYEPMFFDAALPFGEKVSRWRTQPKTSLQLLTNVILLSLLAVAAVSFG
jgi:hypothetical protein